MTTLDQAKQEWLATIHGKGGDCPCCNRWGKVYSRNINKTMVQSLRWLYDACAEKPRGAWINVPNTAPKSVLRSNQLATLRWWGLVERQPTSPQDNRKHSGMWRITLAGMDFVEGLTCVPKKVFTCNGEVVSHGPELVDINTISAGFDFHATMAGSVPKAEFPYPHMKGLQ